VAVSALKRAFVAAAGIDMREADRDIEEYETLEDLFVRELRHGARRIDPDPAAVVCPVDGMLGACGRVRDGTILQVKGCSYSVSKLLSSDVHAACFEGGGYATFYLSPKDYHRVHAPISGNIHQATVVPGRLLPVFSEAVAQVEDLFARNERVITYLDHETMGRVAIVKVGATMVGRITVTYDASIATNVAGQSIRMLSYDPPHRILKGACMGAFELGSTVVLLTEPGRIHLKGLKQGMAVRMGERIGYSKR
jgi:phosphatidylserine decarboxylase